MMTVCDPDWIQTNDLLLRRQLLYSTELPDQNISTNDLPDLKSGCSIQLSCRTLSQPLRLKKRKDKRIILFVKPIKQGKYN